MNRIISIFFKHAYPVTTMCILRQLFTLRLLINEQYNFITYQLIGFTSLFLSQAWKHTARNKPISTFSIIELIHPSHVVFLCNQYCVYLYVHVVLRGPHGRLALPNELPSLNKDVHFTSLQSYLVGNP